MTAPVRVLEGFAGPGGWGEGARMLGIGGVLGIDVDPDACATATAAGHRRMQGDVRALDPEDFPTVTGWISSPPCPTFTTAGKRSGVADRPIVLEGCTRLGDAQADPARDDDHLAVYRRVGDERTALVLETLRFAFRLPNVRWVVAEQVPTVEPVWQDMAAELAMAADFEACHVVELRADDFGAATRRRRTFLIATRDGSPDLTGLPMRAWWSCGRFTPPQQHAPTTVTEFPLTSMAAALGWPAGVRVNTRGNRRTAGGNEFSADRPAVSMTGNGLRAWYRTDLGKPAGLLTPAQAGLLQGFPAAYPWHGSRSSRFQQVADTVSPLIAAAVLGAATRRPWADAVWDRLHRLYGHTRPHHPRHRLCTTDRPATAQLTLFGDAA